METSQILSAIKGAKKGIEKQIQNSQNSTNTLLLQILDELMEMNGKKNKLEDKKNILNLNKKYNEGNLKQDKKLEPSDSESKKSEHKEKKKYPADSKREDSSNGKHLRKFTKLIYKKTFSKLVILQIVIITKIFSKFINIFF